MKKQPAINKGFVMEELLRNYFLRAGYYAVRGVPFVYQEFDVTDIDIWLYGRMSAVSREITIVDAKNKKTPQAIERIFWVQGLKMATKATNAVVATTDRRQEVKDFGKELGISVLDGSFLSRLDKSGEINTDRLSDEEFMGKIDEYSLGKLDGNWRGRITFCKSLLSRGLSFDNCNEWLIHGHFFAEQVVTKPSQREVAVRCLFLICSFLAIAIDYVMREFSFVDPSERSLQIRDGFTYGTKGSVGLKKLVNVAVGLVEQHAVDGVNLSHQIRLSIEHDLAALNSSILGDFFSNIDVANSLFAVAKEFEKTAMLRSMPPHESSTVEMRSMLYCLLDYWGIDRVLFLNSLRQS